MYVAVIPNRGSPPAILLRESYREAGKTKNRTLAKKSGTSPTKGCGKSVAEPRGIIFGTSGYDVEREPRAYAEVAGLR